MRRDLSIFDTDPASQRSAFGTARVMWGGLVERGDSEAVKSVEFDFTCEDRQQAEKLAAYIIDRRGYQATVSEERRPGFQGTWQVAGWTPAQALSVSTLRMLFEWLQAAEALHDAPVTCVKISSSAA
jgi:hypothetical protein